MILRASKRDDILIAAAALLGRSGLDGFSASALAEAAGVSKANLFHHFKSLDDVVIKAFERFALDMQMLAPPPDASFRDWLLGIGAAGFGVGETGQDMAMTYFVFVAKALFDERLRRKVLGTTQAASSAFCELAARLAPEELDAAEARALGDLIFMTADGFAIHLLAFPERRREIQAAWRAFIDRVAPENPGEKKK